MFGGALMGMRPVVEIMFGDFMPLVMDGLINQAAKYRYISGKHTVPAVVRSAVGAGGRFGADPLPEPRHLAARRARAEGRLPVHAGRRQGCCCGRRSATRTRCSSSSTSACTASRARPRSRPSPLGKARIVRRGSDVTIASVMKGVRDALEAAEALRPTGIEAEVVDLRSLRPLDVATVLSSVQRTNRLLAVEEGPRTGGWAPASSAPSPRRPSTSSRTSGRSTTPDTPIPFSPHAGGRPPPRAAKDRGIRAPVPPGGSLMGYRISVDTGGTFTDVVVAADDGTLHHRQGADHLRARVRGHRQRARRHRVRPRDRPGGPARPGAPVHLRHDPRDERDRRGQDRPHGVLHDRGVPGHPAGARGRQARAVPPGLLPAAVRPALPHLRAARADGLRGVGVRAARRGQRDRARSSEALGLGATAIGVSLLWSTVNPEHELRVGELIAEHAPGVPYTLSHQLNPIVREYRRASSTVIDASLKPVMQDFLIALERDLARGRVRRAAVRLDLVRRRVAPARGRRAPDLLRRLRARRWRPLPRSPTATLELADGGDPPDMLVCDTGGTTFDVGLVSDGAIHYTSETWLGGRWIGHITGTRAVDVKSIGAGGGSIAWIDSGGLIHVGPQSAGADPGPGLLRPRRHRADRDRRRGAARLPRPVELPRRAPVAGPRRRRGARSRRSPSGSG